MSDNYGKDPRARTINGWIAALEIFGKYVPRDEYHYVAAEHDIFYIADKPAPLSCELKHGDYVCEWADDVRADAEMLDALGFHWDGDSNSWAKHT